MTGTEREWAEICKSRDWVHISAAFKTGSRAPVDQAYFEHVILTIAKAHHKACDEIDKLKAELAAVKREHEQFASAVADEVMRYQGVWRENRTYARGSCVTHGGGLWFALEATDTRPSGKDGNWKLTVKSGQAP